MNLKTFVALLILSQSCATTASNLVSLDPQVSSATETQIEQPVAESYPKSNHLVPRISFSAVVNKASATAAVNLLNRAIALKPEAIIFEINTGGGEVPAGFMISKAIEASPVPVICVVDKEAQSMGFYILQSCPIRYMTKRSVLMAHEISYSITYAGQTNEWENVYNEIKFENKAMAEHIAKHLKNMTPEQLLAKIAGGHMWIMDWKESLSAGAVDGIVSSTEDVIQSYRQSMTPPSDLIKV